MFVLVTNKFDDLWIIHNLNLLRQHTHMNSKCQMQICLFRYRQDRQYSKGGSASIKPKLHLKWRMETRKTLVETVWNKRFKMKYRNNQRFDAKCMERTRKYWLFSVKIIPSLAFQSSSQVYSAVFPTFGVRIRFFFNNEVRIRHRLQPTISSLVFFLMSSWGR
jgi:hypothetical protein